METEKYANTDRNTLRTILESFVSTSTAVDTILISNRNGLLLAGQGKGVELDLMAAISTALLSLSDKLVINSEKGISDKLVIDAYDHSLVLLHVEGLILTVIGNKNTNTATVLTAGNLASKVLVHSIEKDYS